MNAAPQVASPPRRPPPTASPLPFPIEPGHARRLVAGWLMSAAGYGALSFCIGVFVFGFATSSNRWGVPAGVGVFVLGVLLLAALMPSLVGLVDRGRRMRAFPADELLRGASAPVLLLRSFNDDDLVDLTFTATYRIVPGRYEASLLKTLAALGPAVALGRPGERDPEMGALRLYVKDEHWRRAIAHLVARAAAVVAVVGGTPGLWWEIEFAIRNAPLERLLFFFPYPAPPNMRRSYWRSAFLQHFLWGQYLRRKLFPAIEAERRARYAAFRERINASLPYPLPESLGDARFIAFSPTGHPRLIDPVKPALWTRMATLNVDPMMDIPFTRELRPFVAGLKAIGDDRRPRWHRRHAT